jgi:hypothetical protein
LISRSDSDIYDRTRFLRGSSAARSPSPMKKTETIRASRKAAG